jgi:glycosyltransferase involved in cell wall biosynthesis
MKNFVSIIIPTYNEGKNLENTLKAIRNQDYKKYEIIVSDSRSKDKTIKIAKKYKARVLVDGRKGIGAGRNFGAKFAKGNIVFFVDADTILMSNSVSEVVKSLGKKKVAGVTFPIIPTKPTMRNLWMYMTYNNLVKGSIRTGRPHVGGMCVAYRKTTFDAINGFDENLAAFEDVDLSLRMSKLGKIIFNEKSLALTSPRRVEKWGHLNAFRKYFQFYLKYLVNKKISIKEYEPVR